MFLLQKKKKKLPQTDLLLEKEKAIFFIYVGSLIHPHMAAATP